MRLIRTSVGASLPASAVYRQSAYQLLVASDLSLLAGDHGDLWNSGKVDSAQSTHVPYAGAPLASRWYTRPDMRAPGLIVMPGGWADVDLGEVLPIDSVKLYFSDRGKLPGRFKILGADDLEFANPTVLVDRSAADYQPDGSGPQEFAVHGIRARRIRLWVIDPAAPDGGIDRPILAAPIAPDTLRAVAIRQIEVFSHGRNVALMRPTRERGTQWDSGHAAAMLDGMPSAADGDRVPADACPIETAPLLRKAFTVSRSVKRPTVYVAALGMVDVTVNGRRATEDVLGPPFSDYTKRTVYLTLDVTALVKRGVNVIGATLGNGFFSPPLRGFGERHGGNGPPRVLIQTEIAFADGSRQVVDSDATWKWSRGDIAYDDVSGKYVENRADSQPGWDAPGFEDTHWSGVAVTSSLGGRLVAPMGPPIRIVGALEPDRVQGNHAYFKTLSTGWPQVKINARAGQEITLVGHAPGYDTPPLTFLPAADGPAVLEPRFMYLSGPLDLEVKGMAGTLARDDARILLVHADLKRSSSFKSSNTWLNELYDVDLRTQLNYVGDQPMDPMREKLMLDGVFAETWDGGNAQMPSCGGGIGWRHLPVPGGRRGRFRGRRRCVHLHRRMGLGLMQEWTRRWLRRGAQLSDHMRMRLLRATSKRMRFSQLIWAPSSAAISLSS
jgi:alpha-L-rhamnosidase